MTANVPDAVGETPDGSAEDGSGGESGATGALTATIAGTRMRWEPAELQIRRVERGLYTSSYLPMLGSCFAPYPALTRGQLPKSHHTPEPHLLHLAVPEFNHSPRRRCHPRTQCFHTDTLMPNIRWTTDEEYDFLRQRMPAWLEHRAKGNLGECIQTTFHEWVAEFGLPDLTEKELREADGDNAAAKKAQRLLVRKVSFVTLQDATHTNRLRSDCTPGFSTTRQPVTTACRGLNWSQICSSVHARC